MTNGTCCTCNADLCPDFLHALRRLEDTRKFPVEEFNLFLQEWLSEIEDTLGQKAGEYAHDGDRLFNFRLAAKINNETMAKALWGMATKHLVSIIDLVEGRLKPDPAMVKEKCKDMANYMILLSAVLLEDEVVGKQQR